MKKTRFSFRHEWFGGILYDRNEYEYLFCDDKVANAIVNKIPLDSINFSDRNVKNRIALLSNPGEPVKSELLTTKIDTARNYLSAPMQVYYDLTTKCNLRCTHCYTESGCNRKGELSIDEINKWADELISLGVFKVSIGGGEPLIHPEVEQVFRAFRSRDISVSVSTNGLLLKQKNWAEKFHDIGMRTISISLEGGQKDTYESVRGKGTWNKFIENLKYFSATYKKRYAFRVTITKETVGDVRKILELAKYFGCYAVKFKYLQYGGRAISNPELFPSPNKSRQVVEQALKLSGDIGIKVMVPGYFGIGSLKTTVNRYIPLTVDGTMPYRNNFGCGGGSKGVYVYPNGDYSACVSMGPLYTSGNVRNYNLEEIWVKGIAFNRMRSIRAEEPCLSCKHLETCMGGCRARALEVFKNANAIDPYCPLAKAPTLWESNDPYSNKNLIKNEIS